MLELKNSEDRYIIQQLTRYYDNLLDIMPFQGEVDYEKPIKLVAIAPIFHRHNLIDRKHSKLEIDFLQLKVIESDTKFYLHLKDIDSDQIFDIDIPYQKIDIVSNENLAPPPRLLLDWLGSCTGDEQQGILKMRDKILLFDKRMKEVIDSKRINYGRGKTKICAELCFDKKSHKVVLFLRLPLVNGWREKKPLGRMRIWTDGKTVSHVGHVAEGFGRMKLKSEWKQIPRSDWPRNFQESDSYNSLVPIEITGYMSCIKLPTESIEITLESVEQETEYLSLDALVDIALEKWRERL